MLKETPFIWMDGKLVPWKEATVHVLTHSLHYGLAVFEGIRCYKGTPARPCSGWRNMSSVFSDRLTSFG